MCRQWITPFMRQCIAVSSVVLTMLSAGISIGYNALLFSELRKTKEIPLDVDAESWLASILGLMILVGSGISSLMMETIGRKPTLLTSSIFMITGWISLKLAPSFTLLLTGKIFQGLAVGLSLNAGGIMIGEYCSPRFRGPFVSLIPMAVHSGFLIAHAFGIFYNWRVVTMIFPIFCVPALVLTVLSPESPSYLVIKGRYDECRKVFRWLRGNDENDELEKMIKAAMVLKQSNNQNCNRMKLIKNKIIHTIKVLKDREFKIPIIIMMHLNALNQFNGFTIQDAYSYDVYTAIYGTEKYMFQVITSLDIFRLISSVFAIYIVRRLHRRTVLLIFPILNIFGNFLIATYIYARRHNMLPTYHMTVGVILQHIQFSFIGTCSLALVFVVEGEIFPLSGRGLCGGISSWITSFLIFSNIKSAPYVFTLIGVEGYLCLSTLIIAYAMVVAYVLLPETKNKTLQEIENEFKVFKECDEEAVELKDMTKSTVLN